jgi:hypothetical protein
LCEVDEVAFWHGSPRSVRSSSGTARVGDVGRGSWLPSEVIGPAWRGGLSRIGVEGGSARGL